MKSMRVAVRVFNGLRTLLVGAVLSVAVQGTATSRLEGQQERRWRTRNRLEPGAGVGARTVPRFREGRGGLRCVRYPADRAARRARITGGSLRVVARLRDVVELSGHHHEILHHLAARRTAGSPQRGEGPAVRIWGGWLLLLRDRRRVR